MVLAMSDRFVDLVDLFERSCAKYAERPLYGEKRAGGWVWTTYGEIHRQVQLARAGLAQLGVRAGDRVAIVAKNRAEWVVAAHATYGLGATFVPMYPGQTARDWVFVLRDSAAKVLFVAADRFERVSALRNELPSLEHLVVLDQEGPEGFAELLAMGARAPCPVRPPTPRTIAGFVYTSGIRGFPKAVMHSHGNLVSNVNAIRELFDVAVGETALSFLPWANAYGQTCEVHGLLSMGTAIAISDRWSRLFENLASVRPTILFSAPRVLGLVHRALQASPGFDASAWMGGRLKYLISAGAMLDREVGAEIDACGLPLYEGYGLSEAGPIVTTNAPGARRIGSVGRPVPGVRVEIANVAALGREVGEVVVHGPNVMMGYHERPQETRKVFTRTGGLRTGDLGRLDADGFLYIEGRLEDAFELSSGRVVMPERMEERLALSPFIENAVLWGERRPHVVALIVLDADATRAWAKEEGLGAPILTTDARVHRLIESEVARLGEGFDLSERPLAFALTTERFTLENGLLTPTLKVRRPGVVARHRTTLESLYVDAEESGDERSSHADVA
jgi:long-chain acyl-CoA synthetase